MITRRKGKREAEQINILRACKQNGVANSKRVFFLSFFSLVPVPVIMMRSSRGVAFPLSFSLGLVASKTSATWSGLWSPIYLQVSCTRKAGVIQHLWEKGSNNLPTGKESTSQCLHCIRSRLDTVKLQENLAL